MMKNVLTTIAVIAYAATSSQSFTPTPSLNTRSSYSVQTTQLFQQKENKGIFGAINNFFEELDAFVDDATNRRLGNGASFYGKRKSSFYGNEDSGKKKDKDTPDPTEDYQGPRKAGYFQWMPDENGQMRPVTRLKGQNIERNPNFWDKVYASEDGDE